MNSQTYFEICMTLYFKAITTTMHVTFVDTDTTDAAIRIADVLQAVGTNDVILVGDSIIDMAQVSGVTFYGRDMRYDLSKPELYESIPFTRQEMEMILKQAHRIATDKSKTVTD